MNLLYAKVALYSYAHLDALAEQIDEVVEKNGKKKIVQHKKFPTYVYIKAILDTELWYLITGISGATSFCGPEGRAQELTDEEVKRLGFEIIAEEDLDIAVGDFVKIISGAFQGYTGEVIELNFEKQKVRVNLEMFGRKTPMELDFKDVEKISAEVYDDLINAGGEGDDAAN